MNQPRPSAKPWAVTALACILALAAASPALAQSTRKEHDSIGDRMIPAEAYWGVQTSRAVENFPFNTEKIEHFPTFIKAYAFVKKAAAQANFELGILPKAKLDAISQACDDLIAGKPSLPPFGPGADEPKDGDD